MSKPEDFKFDSRVRDRFLRSRVLSATELEQHLSQLPDLDGEYEVMNDTPQPAVTPTREVLEEPLVFDGIRRLQALSDSHAPALARAGAAPADSARQPASPPAAPPREPSRPLGTPLRSALMESEISGVGAGAVSAALGAMAAEARSQVVFPPPAPPAPPAPPMAPEPSAAPVAFEPPAPPALEVAPAPPAPALEGEPQTPVTLRSQAAPESPEQPAPSSKPVADWEAPYPESEDLA